MPTSVPYIGKAKYCYANSTAMLLASVGEDVPPPTIEVLTGVGLGAMLMSAPRLLYFDGILGPPDVGVSRALTTLGFDFVEMSSPDADHAPFAELREALEHSPVLIGPVDLGLLSYRPQSRGAYEKFGFTSQCPLVMEHPSQGTG